MPRANEPVPVDATIFDEVMPALAAEGAGTAFILYLYLWRRAVEGEAVVTASVRTLAAETRIPRSTLSDALRFLVERGLLGVEREGRSGLSRYRLLGFVALRARLLYRRR